MIARLLAGVGSIPGVVTVTTDSYTNPNGPVITLMYSGVRVNIDGTIDQISGDSGGGGPIYTQQNASTDWIIPNIAAIGKTYHWKFDLDTGDALDIGTEGTWQQLISTKSWAYTSSSGDKSGTFTLSVSSDGGSTTLDSMSGTISLTNV